MNPTEARLDADSAYFLETQLTHIEGTEYPVLFRGARYKALLPPVTDMDPTALSHRYHMVEVLGDAGVAGKIGADAKAIELRRTPTTVDTERVEASFGWDVDEIRRAAKVGAPLERDTAQAAMARIKNNIDRIVAVGSPAGKITGLLTHPSIHSDLAVPATKAATGTAWFQANVLVATADEMIKDINNLVSVAWQTMQQAQNWVNGDEAQVFEKWVVIVPTTHWAAMNATPRSLYSDTTVLEYLTEKNDLIDSIEPWVYANTADSGTDPLFCAYPRNPLCLGYLVTREYQQEQPQYRGLRVAVPASGRTGGALVRYPVACQYMTDI